jgi:hypothetical protein
MPDPSNGQPEAAPVVDLMAALEASLAKARAEQSPTTDLDPEPEPTTVGTPPRDSVSDYAMADWVREGGFIRRELAPVWERVEPLYEVYRRARATEVNPDTAMQTALATVLDATEYAELRAFVRADPSDPRSAGRRFWFELVRRLEIAHLLLTSETPTQLIAISLGTSGLPSATATAERLATDPTLADRYVQALDEGNWVMEVGLVEGVLNTLLELTGLRDVPKSRRAVRSLRFTNAVHVFEQHEYQAKRQSSDIARNRARWCGAVFRGRTALWR